MARWSRRWSKRKRQTISKSEVLKIHGRLKQRATSPQVRMGSEIKAQKEKSDRGQKTQL